MCDDIYIGNTQQTLKKIIDGHFSDFLRLLDNGKKSYSFAIIIYHVQIYISI